MLSHQTNYFDRQLIEESLKALTTRNDFCDKLVWYMRSGGRAEKFLQFDLAFSLEKSMQTRHQNAWTACERKISDSGQADICIYTYQDIAGPTPKSPTYGLELKCWGNWGIMVGELRADIEKVKHSKVPLAALAVCFYAEPNVGSQCNPYAWIPKGKSANEILQMLKDDDVQLVGTDFEVSWQSPKPHLHRLGFWAFVHFNQAAKALGSS